MTNFNGDFLKIMFFSMHLNFNMDYLSVETTQRDELRILNDPHEMNSTGYVND